MKKLLLVCVFLFFFFCSSPLWADRTKSGFSDDLLQQKSLQSLPAQSIPTMPTTTSPSLSSGTTIITGSGTLPGNPIQPSLSQPSEITTPMPSLQEGGSLISPVQNTLRSRDVKIKVPDYEKQLQEMMQQEQAKMMAKNKKKKTLQESVMEEVTKYGLLMLMGLVIAAVIYAMKKEPKPKSPTEQPPAPFVPQEEKKKDIWHENF